MDVATQSILMKLPLGCVLMYNQWHINIRHECIGKATNRFKPLHTNTASAKTTQEKNSAILAVTKQQRSMWTYTCEFNRLVEIAMLVAVNFIKFSIQLNTGFWIAFTDCAEW